jgi:hypothetical protein
MSPGAALPADDEAAPVAFLETDPPHWVARGLTWILIALFVSLAVISVAIEVPETVSAPFVLVPASATPAGAAGSDDGSEELRAAVTVPQSALALIAPGQPVKMLYDAFPYQRYGVRYGTVRSSTPVRVAGDDSSEFVVIADPAERVVVVNGQARPLLPGMSGTVRISLGSRSLIAYVFEPLQVLRETMEPPPAVPGSIDDSPPADAR